MLDFLCSPHFWGEVAKMAAQFLGATAIAWLTVQWALGRYKTEKMWERETTEILGLLSTLSELEDLISEWLSNEHDHLSHHAPPPKEKSDARRQRYVMARNQLRSARALADVILPEEFGAEFEDLEQALDFDPPDGDYVEAYEKELTVLRRVRSEIVAHGRQLRGKRS